MSQQPGTIAPETKPQALAQALIRGRIVGKPRSFKAQDGSRRYATLIKLPNPSEFDNAGTVEVQSPDQLGEVGDSWSGKVRITGSVRPFQYPDRATGEMKQGVDCTIRLTVAE